MDYYYIPRIFATTKIIISLETLSVYCIIYFKSPIFRTGVTDLVLLVLRLLRRGLRELVDTIELVDLYNKG